MIDSGETGHIKRASREPRPRAADRCRRDRDVDGAGPDRRDAAATDRRARSRCNGRCRRRSRIRARSHRSRFPRDLALEVTSAGGCASSTKFPLATRFNVDDVPNSSATDTFDAAVTPWVAWASAWHHVFGDDLDGSWHGDALGVTSDVRLSSPPMHASDAVPVTLTFSHRFSFEMSNGSGLRRRRDRVFDRRRRGVARHLDARRRGPRTRRRS